MTADEFINALVTGGEGWLVLSIAAVLPMLWTFTLILHFARPYMLRFLQTLTLRFGGDIWWLGYVLVRDALMVVTLVLSVTFLFPNLYIGLGLPLTAPLATVVLFWALCVKFLRDADDDPGAFRLVSILLVIASVLYIVPQIYGLEAADQVDRLASYGLDWLPGALQANTDAGVNALAWPILDISLVLVAVTGAALFTRFLLGIGKEEPAAEEAPSPRPESAAGASGV
jgi:hypothetical protein